LESDVHEFLTVWMVAKAAFPYAGTDLAPGDKFLATPDDAKYLEPRGKAELASAPSSSAPSSSAPSPSAPSPSAPSPSAPSPSAPSPSADESQPAADAVSETNVAEPAAEAAPAPARKTTFARKTAARPSGDNA
jgi:hypothetical protein